MADKRILVIDDDVNICELLRIYLENEGYNVLTSENGIQALEVIKRNEILHAVQW